MNPAKDRTIAPAPSAVNPLLGTCCRYADFLPCTNELIARMNPCYVRLGLYYERYTNPGSGTRWGAENGVEFYDKSWALNTNYKVILTLDDVPLDQIARFVPMILEKYPAWGVSPVNEKEDVELTHARVDAFHRVVPRARLVGPDLQNTTNWTYIEGLKQRGTLAMLDVAAFHDYFQVPSWTGHRFPWTGLPYCHPDDPVRPEWGGLNLPARLNKLKTLIPYLRRKFEDGPELMITEHGLYCQDRRDAFRTAQIYKETGIPCFLANPEQPCNYESSYPYFNAVYSEDAKQVRWTEPMLYFLAELNAPHQSRQGDDTGGWGSNSPAAAVNNTNG